MTTENTPMDALESIDVPAEDVTPELTPEQQAMNQKMGQIALEVGNSYIQDAARLLANVSGALGIPVNFSYDTQNGGKAVVLALAADTETITKLMRVIEAVVTPVVVQAPESPGQEDDGSAQPPAGE